MQRLITLVFVLFLGINAVKAQVSVGRMKTVSSIGEFKNGDIERLKKATTIFVLPFEHDIEEYKTILEEAWTFNEFEVIEVKDYNPLKYLGSKYLIASLGARTMTSETVSSFVPYMSFKSYDSAGFKKKYKNLSPAAKKRRKEELLNRFSDTYAYVFLSTKIDVWAGSMGGMDNLVNSMYEKNGLYNFDLGSLFNIFQSVSNLLDKGEKVSYTYEYTSPKLKELQNETLYFTKTAFDKFKRPLGGLPKLEETNVEQIEKIMESYKGDYKMLSVEELENKILSQERIFYLKYTRMVGTRVLEVIDSSDGSTIFNTRTAGIKINLTENLIKFLGKEVRK